MDPLEAYDRYVRAWNEPGLAAALLDEAWAEDGVYADDEVPDGVVGPAALVALIQSTYEASPDFQVRSTSEPRMLAGRMAVTWAADGVEPGPAASGTDVIEFTPDGRIARVTDVLSTG
jgi:hypothetical protein